MTSSVQLLPSILRGHYRRCIKLHKVRMRRSGVREVEFFESIRVHGTYRCCCGLVQVGKTRREEQNREGEGVGKAWLIRDRRAV